jgi:ATP-binding cassette subfamily F protein uup
VRTLSGGERNRLLLAKALAAPSNMIVLDEPTNDLDAETLEMLEARLVEFEGTVLLVSHDRSFLNNVVTSTIVFEDGGVNEYIGGYDDWQRQRRQRLAVESAAAPKPAAKKSAPPVAAARPAAANGARRLSFKERKELESLPGTIEQYEGQIESLHADMAQPAFYQQPGTRIAEEQARLKQLEYDLAVAYARWEELEQLAN